jgi:xylulokinase
MGGKWISYEEMNAIGNGAAIGSDGLVFIPFGNGVERIMQNKPVGAHMLGLDLLKHDRKHVVRAAQEGIVASLTYGFRIMKAMGMNLKTVKAGKANMFLSPLFRKTFVQMNEVNLELYDTDGAQGAARGAGIGAGIFASESEAFAGLELLETLEPNPVFSEPYLETYSRWENKLNELLKSGMAG